VKRILFVDDEPQILDGLRDLLRRERREWEMEFALGGEEALRRLAERSYDVVVSDMRMPGMDGATLLTRVRDEHPDTVRIVLSGYTELEAALRAVPVAHQFLAKPCERDVLRGAVDRALQLRELLANEPVRAAITEVGALPSVPRTFAELNEALVDPGVPMTVIADIVGRDIALCAKVLQLVNSAFFGLGRQIASINEAVSYLGLGTIRTLVLSLEAFQQFDAVRLPAGETLEGLHRHALLVGALASRIPGEQRNADDALTAGLLHDVGKLVLALRRPAELARAYATARAERRPLHQAEEELFGVSHAEIGAYLLGLWGLPLGVVGAVANHHHPERVEPCGLDALAAVHIADALAHECSAARAGQAPCALLDPQYLEAVGAAASIDRWRLESAAECAGLDLDPAA
jgi:putative nucleotidyltransferase with HDIG domain